jgi:zinc protease
MQPYGDAFVKVMFMILLRLCLVATCAQFVVAQVPAGELKLPPHRRARLENGMTLLLMEQHEVPLISFRVVIRSGAVADPTGKEGVASITAELLRKGTKTRSADQLSEELDFVGGQLSTGAGPDSSNMVAEFMKKDLAKGLDLLADVMLTPTFPSDEVTKIVKQRVDGIKAAKDRAQGVIGQYFNAYLYGKQHPYGRSSTGDEESLRSITREDVVRFYETNYVPAGVIFVAVGDFDAADMEKLLNAKFAAWRSRTVATVRLPDPTVAHGKRLLLVDKLDATQTFFRIGNLGIARSNPDRVWISVVNTLFGGRFTSWLSTELRIKSGLTYGAGSSFDERLKPGPFFISSFTPNETTVQALDLTLATLKRLHEQGMTEDELKSAKTYIRGQFPLQLETTDHLAETLAELELIGLDEREIDTFNAKVDAMTLADTRRIVRQYFPLENLVFVLIGKASEIEPVVKKYAETITRKTITQPGF